ncbi:2'-5' RNA ligase family protein [Microbacterium sp. 11MF]|uniref:2'-5' RNA ligase family protein n=1 Tax=Microbacterium sp. 11MF TaxID=1169146 RepID=UPI000378D964|nr:2'-5' RNA ligase family protein [Microbacterium sp. 11MF]
MTAVRGAPVVSIELEFDAATERAVRAEWQALADAGLSSLAAHTSPSNAPHVTLLVRLAVTLARVPLPAAFPVTLGAVVLFGAGERRVLARSVVPSADLLALHAAVHEAAGAGEDAPHTAPGEWMPHVTLARRLKVSDLGRALPLLGDPILGTAHGLRRWDAASATVTSLGEFGG